MDPELALILKNDLSCFTEKVFKTVDPSAVYLHNWHINLISEYLLACQRGEIKRLIINIPPRFLKSISVSVAFPAWLMGHNPSAKILTASYSQGLSFKHSIDCRLTMQSDWYTKLFPDTVLVEDQNTKAKFVTTARGHRIATSVGGTITGEGGDVLIVDDPHSALNAQSEAMRQTACNWFDQTFSTRLNDKKKGSIIVIMQRLHEDDLTGHLLKKGGWEHLSLPLIAEKDEILEMGSIRIERKIGDNLHPERMGDEEIQSIKQEIGSYGFCTPKESPVLMADLSMKPISQIQIGDKIIGIDVNTKPILSHECRARRKLIVTEVHDISKSIREVVKVTLDSGKVVRCTPDHKWYTGRGSDSSSARKLYNVATIGKPLIRICDEQIPTLESKEDIRDAGWLAGFFDGEGSAVISKRRSHDSAACLITFTQGIGRNIILCDELERVLKKFGFSFNYIERLRSDRIDKGIKCKTMRSYWLKNNGLPMYQKFLHVINPLKWRDRIALGALGTNFIQGREKVVAIEPDGTEEVYGLNTTTGNYVVWGLGSSNSGQYQQRPSPEGGGEFRKEWLKEYESITPSTLNKYILVDPANSKQKKSDYTAMWVVGFGADKNCYVVDMVRDKLNTKERCDMVFDLHEKYKPQGVYYQKYGIEADIDYIKSEMGRRNYHFTINPVSTRVVKEDRIRRLIPWFFDGRIWLPNTLYKTNFVGQVNDVIDQFIHQEYLPFPVGVNDDLLDSLAMIADIPSIQYPGQNTINYHELYSE